MNSPFPPPDGNAGPGALNRAALAAAAFAFENGAALDRDGAFPAREIGELHRAGLLTAPLPPTLGGVGPGAVGLADILRAVGGGSLPLGRLYEGHVNALALVLRYGDAGQAMRAARDAAAGRLFGVWNTDDSHGLRLLREGAGYRLEGRKILASGAGFLARPLVTANDEDGRRVMVLVRPDDAPRADLAQWTAQGMRASATGAFDFSGLAVTRDDIIGGDGDYERQPFFSAGAWRFCAVQQGAMATLLDLLRAHLTRTRRGGDPHQAARLGEAAIAVETARLWVTRAVEIAEAGGEASVAYVNLARIAVERCGLDLIELTHRSIGLQSFMRPNPIERIARDLSTYLRQPAPDRALDNGAAWLLAAPASAHTLWDLR